MKESEDTLDKHVDSRDNKAIPDFLASVKDIGDRADLFRSAVLKLTCKNDWDTLGAVLEYGKQENLGVQWMTAEEYKEKTPEVQDDEEEEGRKNPIIIASEQVSFCCSTFCMTDYNSLTCVSPSRATFSAQKSFTSLATGFLKFNPTKKMIQLGNRRSFERSW